MNLEDKLRYVRNLRRLTQVDLSKLAEVSQDTISRIETGVGPPRDGTLHRLADALKVRVEWLADPEKGLESLEVALLNEGVRVLQGGRAVPVFPLGPGTASAWSAHGFPTVGVPKGFFPLPPEVTEEGAFYCEVSGDRNVPDLIDGDLVLVIPVRGVWREGAICFVQFPQEAHLGRVFTSADQRVRIVACNRTYAEIVVDRRTENIVIYPALAVTRFLTGGQGHGAASRG